MGKAPVLGRSGTRWAAARARNAPMRKYLQKGIDIQLYQLYNDCIERREDLNEKYLSFKISEKLYNQLDQEREEKGLSLAAMVRVILSEHFERRQK